MQVKDGISRRRRSCAPSKWAAHLIPSRRSNGKERKVPAKAVSMGNSEWCAAIHASNFTTTIGIIIRAKKSKKMG
jgi:hypothetical protein